MSASLPAALFGRSVICCVDDEVAIVRASLRGSRLSGEPVATPPSGTSAMPRARRALELLWVVLPALVLAVVLGATWRAVSAPPIVQIHRDGMTRGPHR